METLEQMEYLSKLIKRIKTWWFEYQLRKHYRPDTYVYEDEENFELEKESQESKNSS